MVQWLNCSLYDSLCGIYTIPYNNSGCVFLMVVRVILAPLFPMGSGVVVGQFCSLTGWTCDGWMCVIPHAHISQSLQPVVLRTLRASCEGFAKRTLWGNLVCEILQPLSIHYIIVILSDLFSRNPSIQPGRSEAGPVLRQAVETIADGVLWLLRFRVFWKMFCGWKT